MERNLHHVGTYRACEEHIYFQNKIDLKEYIVDVKSHQDALKKGRGGSVLLRSNFRSKVCRTIV